MTRRRLAPTSLLALLTLGLLAFAPSVGLRVHKHADDGPAHVHFEDLLGGRPASEPAVQPAASQLQRSATEQAGTALSSAPSHALLFATPLDATAVDPADALASRANAPELQGPIHGAHAHASSRFLRTIPAALVCWVVGLFVVAAGSDRAIPLPLPRAGHARARSPPLASRSLRTI